MSIGTSQTSAMRLRYRWALIGKRSNSVAPTVDSDQPGISSNTGLARATAAAPTGSTVTGQSGMSLSTPTTTVTLPFKVVNVVTSPPGAPGTDLTAAYNNVIVAFNNQQYKALLGV